ncbi:MAG: hypothetical protein QOJ00_2279 [Actinomycetota bacterium]|jgi:hypothetical protein
MRRWIVVLGTSSLVAVVLVGPHLAGFHEGRILVSVAVFFGCFAFVLALPIRRAVPVFTYLTTAVGPAICLLLWMIGSRFEAVIAVMPLITTGVFILFRRRTAIITVTAALASYTTLVVLASGYVRPAAHVLLLTGVTFAAAGLFTRLAAEMKIVADRERDAHAAVDAMR